MNLARTESGYTNNEINMHWVQHVFGPQAKAKANGKPRILVSDGLASHESLDVVTFCYENNIVLCRLPSHTPHKLQPCDVAVFGPLKTAYHEQVERLFRGGAGTIGKQHFTLLYSRARITAMTVRNMRAAWSQADLVPLNPHRVLESLKAPPPPQLEPPFCPRASVVPGSVRMHGSLLTPRTPTSASGLERMREALNDILNGLNDGDVNLHVQKLFNVAEQPPANYVFLVDENKSFELNREKNVHQTVSATILGTAKIMT